MVPVRADKYLAGITGELGRAGFVDFAHELVGGVWRTNLERYEPEELGDTVRSLGQLSAANITELASRRLSNDRSWRDRGFHVSTPDSALLVQHRGLSIRFVKAPPHSGLAPDWAHDFNWRTGSGARYEAAEANTRVLGGAGFQQQITPLFELEETRSGVRGCRDVFLVWAGTESPGSRTAGWLGLPHLGPSKWLAVEPLWKDEPGSAGAELNSNPKGPASAPSLDEPAPVRIASKRNRSRSTHE